MTNPGEVVPRAQLPEELGWGWRRPRSIWDWGWRPPPPDLPGLGPCPRLGHGPWFESLSSVPGASAFQALPMQGSTSRIIGARRGEAKLSQGGLCSAAAARHKPTSRLTKQSRALFIP